MMVGMPRNKTLTPAAWTPNQIVAHNISKARLMRGWTQEQAAEACEPFLGTKLSNASWSALERSVDGNRIRQIDADELIGFARGFDLPIGWFLTPPSALDGHVVASFAAVASLKTGAMPYVAEALMGMHAEDEPQSPVALESLSHSSRQSPFELWPWPLG